MASWEKRSWLASFVQDSTTLDWRPSSKATAMSSVLPPRCAWADTFNVPAVGKPRLLLRVATEGKGPSELAVYVEGTRIWQEECSTAKTGDGWKDRQVDLSSFKGKRVWVVVRHHPAGVEATYSYWEKIALME